ncbi:hypothetical protein [Nonomuraea sp. KM90]|uniref:hypothetical protein n=1 Tax=Nonomuraea sp. KM90 TaxID=3457428 RepID=UPI003FCEDF00
MTLQPAQARIIAIGRPSLFGDRTGTRPHVVTTDADAVRFDGRHLTIRATHAAACTTTLSDGRSITSAIGPVPSPIPLTSWHLTVEDWRPVSKIAHSLTLDPLVRWSAIPELADASGVGTYTTTVDLTDTSAYLELGGITDTCRVRVNGRPLAPVDQIHPVIDLAGVLSRQPYGLLGPVRLVPYAEAEVQT